MFIQDTQLFLYLPQGKRVLQPFLPNKVREVKLEKHKKILIKSRTPLTSEVTLGLLLTQKRKFSFVWNLRWYSQTIIMYDPLSFKGITLIFQEAGLVS